MATTREIKFLLRHARRWEGRPVSPRFTWDEATATEAVVAHDAWLKDLDLQSEGIAALQVTRNQSLKMICATFMTPDVLVASNAQESELVRRQQLWWDPSACFNCRAGPTATRSRSRCRGSRLSCREADAGGQRRLAADAAADAHLQ